MVDHTPQDTKYLVDVLSAILQIVHIKWNRRDSNSRSIFMRLLKRQVPLATREQFQKKVLSVGLEPTTIRLQRPIKKNKNLLLVKYFQNIFRKIKDATHLKFLPYCSRTLSRTGCKNPMLTQMSVLVFSRKRFTTIRTLQQNKF